jgi:anti-sigma B factor antagonist
VPEPNQSSGALRLNVSRPTPTCVLLRVEGEVDLLTAPTLDAELTKHLTESPAPTVVLDLDPVAFFGSSGIAALVHAAELARQHEARMIVVASGRAVLRPLEVTNTVRLFTVHASVESALADV